LLDEAMHKKAVDDFCLAMKQNITPALKQGLIVRSPDAVRAILDAALAKAGIEAEVQSSDGAEVETQIAGMVIETNISEWAARLRELIVNE
jgi:hypothetical protein